MSKKCILKLSTKERLMFGSLLPKSGSLLELTIVKGVVDEVALSKDEIEKIGLKSLDGGSLKWDDGKSADKKIELSEGDLGFLKECVQRLDKEKQITQDTLGLCVKIRECEAKDNKG